MSNLITEDGNIRRYLGSEIIDEFDVNQVAYIDYPNGYGHGKRTSDLAFTLTVASSGRSQVYKQNDLRIRRLTPREYWRLMDFDDEDFNKAQKVVSDSQLYKQAGNSIVVNVLVGIFGQMFEGKEDDYKKK